MLATSQKQSYWERVQAALEIAGAPNELADSLRQKVESLPKDQQELFYHAEPLDVARDLSGVERWSDEQVRAYLEQSSIENMLNDQLEAPIPVWPQGEGLRFFYVIIIVLALNLGVDILVAVSLQNSQLTPTLSIFASGVATLIVLAVLMFVIALPAYKYTRWLKKELHYLEGEMRVTLARNQHLNEEMKEALAQNLSLEKEMKAALAQTGVSKKR